MFRQIKKMNPRITSGTVIRQSVITEWTKTIGIREVQYMAGYRCVGSVERYKNYNLEELTEALNEYHPLNWNHVTNKCVTFKKKFREWVSKKYYNYLQQID